jgi:hypothetical protein
MHDLRLWPAAPESATIATRLWRKEIEMSPRWEYMTFDLAKPKTQSARLTQLGSEGWEAVAMVSSWGVGWRWVHPIVLLKRALPDAP